MKSSITIHVKCPCCGGDLTVHYSPRPLVTTLDGLMLPEVLDTEGCECSLYLELYDGLIEKYNLDVRQNVLKEIRYYG